MVIKPVKMSEPSFEDASIIVNDPNFSWFHRRSGDGIKYFVNTDRGWYAHCGNDSYSRASTTLKGYPLLGLDGRIHSQVPSGIAEVIDQVAIARRNRARA